MVPPKLVVPFHTTYVTHLVKAADGVVKDNTTTNFNIFINLNSAPGMLEMIMRIETLTTLSRNLQ